MGLSGNRSKHTSTHHLSARTKTVIMYNCALALCMVRQISTQTDPFQSAIEQEVPMRKLGCSSRRFLLQLASQHFQASWRPEWQRLRLLPKRCRPAQRMSVGWRAYRAYAHMTWYSPSSRPCGTSNSWTGLRSEISEKSKWSRLLNCRT